ncbi:MAG TPA: hypothetical protein VFI33_14855 [Puia sp.]|nr:hypothetical protein [Puia sp.]
MQLQAQPITGIWKGKMGNSRVELKLIRKGDSLIGTSYYYDSKSNYRRYSVKGYFDDRNNDVIWYDDVLIEEHSSNRSGPLLAVADFNCPGEGVMKLDGNSSGKEDNKKDKKELHLVKGNAAPVFPDEWDFLIENYAYGVSHPEIVDSIEQMAFNSGDVADPAPNPRGQGYGGEAVQPINNPSPQTKMVLENPTAESYARTKQTNTVIEKPATPGQVTAPVFLPPALQTNEQRFTSRTKILQNVIPVKGDSIELRFYDNAEIDGDSIAVFLNGRLLKEHILLAEEAYIMKIAVTDLQSDNELVMVAENLGSIPPNTSLMVAIVDDKRYEAHLQSTEGSSALVRLVKP